MSQQTFKVGDRVTVIALKDGPYLGKPLPGTITDTDGKGRYYIKADDEKYAVYKLYRLADEITPLVVPEPTNAELAVTYRAGREAAKALLKRGFTIARWSDGKTVNFAFEPVIYKVEETTVLEPVVKRKRVDI